MIYYIWFDNKNQHIKKEACLKSYATKEAPSGISRIENFSKIFHPDDLVSLYQNKGHGLRILPYNHDLKKRARSQSNERIEKVKEYCKKAIPTNRYLRLANQHVEDTNKFLYFDFYYSFLYCQTQKVTLIYALQICFNLQIF